MDCIPEPPELAERDPRWESVRKHWLEKHPACEVCGATNGEIEVHHVLPVHWPGGKDHELDEANFQTLCRVHHFWNGHLGDWKSRNEHTRSDADRWHKKIKYRPYPPK